MCKAGEPRDANNIVVVVAAGMPFGATAGLTGKKVTASRVRGLHFTDMDSDGVIRSSLMIAAPILIRGARLVIDMLPRGQLCELSTQVGEDSFVASPGTEIRIK